MKEGFSSIWIWLAICVLIGIMGWISYLNRGSQQTLEVLKPVVGGVTIAFILMLVNIFMTSVNINNYRTDILILLKKDCSLVPLENWTYSKFGMESSPMGGYGFISSQHHNYLKSLNKDELVELISDFFDGPNLNDAMGYPYLLELIEWSTFTWMEHYYGKHWETRWKNFKGISAQSGSGVKPLDAAKQVVLIPIEKILIENRFVKKGENIFGKSVVPFPNSTQISYEKVDQLNSIVTIDTPCVTATMKFQIGFGGNIRTTDLAQAILKKEKDAGWNQQLIVDINVIPKKLRRWSKETKKQLEWMEDFAKIFNDRFSWDVLDVKLRQSLGIDMYWSDAN